MTLLSVQRQDAHLSRLRAGHDCAKAHTPGRAVAFFRSSTVALSLGGVCVLVGVVPRGRRLDASGRALRLGLDVGVSAWDLALNRGDEPRFTIPLVRIPSGGFLLLPLSRYVCPRPMWTHRRPACSQPKVQNFVLIPAIGLPS